MMPHNQSRAEDRSTAKYIWKHYLQHQGWERQRGVLFREWVFYPSKYLRDDLHSPRDLWKHGISGVHYANGYVQLFDMVKDHLVEVNGELRLSRRFEGDLRELPTKSADSATLGQTGSSQNSPSSIGGSFSSDGSSSTRSRKHVPLNIRLEEIEIFVYGEIRQGSFNDRIKALEREFFRTKERRRGHKFSNRISRLEKII